MFFYCENCKSFVKEEELKSASFIDFETGFQGVKLCCPHCRSDYLKRAIRCLRCGSFFFSPQYLCPQCVRELKAELDRFLENYSPEEQEAMLCE